MRQEMMGLWKWQYHQLDHMQTICTSLQADNPTNTLSLGLYKPNALPDPNKQSNTLGKSLLVLD